MEINGIVKSIQDDKLTISTDGNVIIPSYYKDKKTGLYQVEVTVLDPRKITSDQRGYIFGLFNDISDYTGYPPDYIKELMKALFCIERGLDSISLSRNGITQSLAGYLIEFIIDWCFQEGVPFRNREYYIGSEHTRILFLFLKNRRCFISGEKGEVAHYDAVGMGRNRNKIDHSQHRFMCLSHKYHMEQHQIGIKEFMLKYKVVPIKLTPEQVKEFRI